MVDLPVPEGPTIAVSPPGGSSKLRSRCTQGLSSVERYRNHTPLNATAVGRAPGDGALPVLPSAAVGSVGSSCSSRIRTTAASAAWSWVVPLTSELIGSLRRNR
jgi:hypothetical protein